MNDMLFHLYKTRRAGQQSETNLTQCSGNHVEATFQDKKELWFSLKILIL